VPTLGEIGERIEKAGVKCRWCETEIKAINIESYPHEGGIEVNGYSKKQWVYFTCPKCDYQWALHKLLNQIKA